MENKIENPKLVKSGDEWKFGGWQFKVANDNIANEVSERIEEFKPAEISGYSFMNFKGLIQITIPKSVTSIEEGAFRGCSSLQSITIPDSVTNISKNAFMYCSNLKEIAIPSKVTNIGIWSFWNCKNLKKIDMPYGVTSIESWAFKDCSSLEEITIPSSVTSIGDSVFEGCSNLEKINISKSLVQQIGENNIHSKLGLNPNVKILIDGPEIIFDEKGVLGKINVEKNLGVFKKLKKTTQLKNGEKSVKNAKNRD